MGGFAVALATDAEPNSNAINSQGCVKELYLIDAHKGGDVGGLEQGEEVMGSDKVENVGLLQAQQDGQRKVEAPLQLVQVRRCLQQRLAVAPGSPRPTHIKRA